MNKISRKIDRATLSKIDQVSEYCEEITKKMLKTLPGLLGMKEGKVCHTISTFKTQGIIKTSGMII